MIKTKDTIAKMAADVVRGTTGSVDKMEQAVQNLSLRGDQIAEKLQVEEGPAWRDQTGTSHLIIRGAFQSLDRIANDKHDMDEAANAMGTVGFAAKSPDGFMLKDASSVANIAKKILQTEMTGGSVQDAVSKQDLAVIKDNLNAFALEMATETLTGDVHPSTKAFTQNLLLANKWCEKIAHEASLTIEAGYDVADYGNGVEVYPKPKP